MASVTSTYMTDDHGSEGDVSTVQIARDNTSYEIDLGSASQVRLRETLTKYLDAATEVKTKPVTRRGKKSAPVASARPNKAQTQAIREWAKANGHKVSDRGRIPAAAQEAFPAAD
jgi:hypothetical protein